MELKQTATKEENLKSEQLTTELAVKVLRRREKERDWQLESFRHLRHTLLSIIANLTEGKKVKLVLQDGAWTGRPGCAVCRTAMDLSGLPIVACIQGLHDDGGTDFVCDNCLKDFALELYAKLKEGFEAHDKAFLREQAGIIPDDESPERLAKIDHYRIKPLTKFVQYDAFFDCEGDSFIHADANGIGLCATPTKELMTGNSEVRVLVVDDRARVDTAKVVMALRKIADWIERSGLESWSPQNTETKLDEVVAAGIPF